MGYTRSLACLRSLLARLALPIVLAPLAAVLVSCGGGGSSAPPTLVSVEITPASASVPNGLTHQFTATGRYSDSSTADLTSAVLWFSSNPTVATVNTTSGLAKTLTEGSTVIIASAPPLSGRATLNVTPGILQSISITPSPASAFVGRTMQFEAWGIRSDGNTVSLTASVSWSSGTPAVAVINGVGLATALSAGSTLITATYSEGNVTVSGTIDFAVASNTVQSISIAPNPAFSGIGLALQLRATGTYADGTTADVTALATWTSIDPAVATIGATTGMTTGIALGSSTISATIGAVNATTTLAIIANTWSPSAGPQVPRSGHTATLLAGGKVLVVGGATANVDLAEIFDPIERTWSRPVTNSMLANRFGHTATLLPNGKVLVVGGLTRNAIGDNEFLATAELYDALKAMWSPTGSLSTGRAQHTATLLSNGKVLVVGGQTLNEILATAELYDAVTGMWSPTGSLSTGRSGHTATLLQNGKVLVVGYNSAELYDPNTGTWSATGSPAVLHAGHTTTLLPSGKVLVVGGVGGSGACPASAELYDVIGGIWSTTGKPLQDRCGHTATRLPSGAVLVTGGRAPFGTKLASAELYDPATGTWSLTSQLLTARQSHTATLTPNGMVVVVGGESQPNTVELYWQ